jgi:hypothetical protein
MQNHLLLKFLLTGIFGLITLAACNGNNPNLGAPAAIQTYLQALVDRDVNQMIASSCAAWESQARVELNSFTAVKLKLQDLNCQEAGQDTGYTLVSCTGLIMATYGTEEQQINLAGRKFRAVQEGGEWRMCGYP